MTTGYIAEDNGWTTEEQQDDNDGRIGASHLSHQLGSSAKREMESLAFGPARVFNMALSNRCGVKILAHCSD